jgi:nitrogen-specific signal transduction histidine kinase
VDAAGGICRANAVARELFGAALEEDSPKLPAILLPGEAVPDLLARGAAPADRVVPLKCRGKDGNARSYDALVCAFMEPDGKTVVIQLLPARGPESKSQGGDAALLHKQKLDCALQLARTVALDFNNALTSILGHTSLLLSRMEPTHPWRASLIEVEKSAAKAAEIANDLGTFSRQEKEVRAQAAGNLNLLLQRSVEFFQQNPGPEPVSWKLQFERRLFTAKFDEAKMQQAFIKILENSVQALESNGRVTVTTRNLELKEATQDRNVQLAAGAYVCAEISDNGTGIAPEVLPRIFEPFFTTKRSHRGLGLAWVYGIVTNHGGGVAVSSQAGNGTSVRVYLPAEKRIVWDKGVANDNLGGDQTILIVDDEDLLLTMGQTILSSYGYRVLTASSGQIALDTLGRDGVSVDLVITDLVMPVMSGRELIDQIRVRFPATRFICTSGYVWPGNPETEGAYLQKPFTSHELLLKVKQALADAEAS